MKTILYIGAALMIGASIYGFADYQRTRHKKEFNTMYQDEPVAKTPETKTVTATPVQTAAVTQTEGAVKTDKPAVAEKTKKKKRRFSIDEFSRAPIREEIEEMPVDSAASAHH